MTCCSESLLDRKLLYNDGNEQNIRQRKTSRELSPKGLFRAMSEGCSNGGNHSPVITGHEPHEHVRLMSREDDLSESHIVMLSRVGRIVLYKCSESSHQLPVRLQTAHSYTSLWLSQTVFAIFQSMISTQRHALVPEQSSQGALGSWRGACSASWRTRSARIAEFMSMAEDHPIVSSIVHGGNAFPSQISFGFFINRNRVFSGLNLRVQSALVVVEHDEVRNGRVEVQKAFSHFLRLAAAEVHPN